MSNSQISQFFERITLSKKLRIFQLNTKKSKSFKCMFVFF